jgi:hypothetical protein
MTLTANQLISDALHLSEIVSIDFETPTGAQISEGLRLLNGILDESSLDSVLIPFYTHQYFNTVIGQEIYPIPNLIECTSLTFNINTVRFPMVQDSLNRYNATGRVDNILSLPFHYYVEKYLGGSYIYLYFIPDQVFEMRITGKFTIVDIALGDNVEQFYPPYYCKWLTYRLAAEFSELYGMEINQFVAKRLDNLERRLNKMVGADLTIDKYRMITRPPVDDMYGQANIGKGWTTS